MTFRQAYNTDDWAAQFACIAPDDRATFVFRKLYVSMFLLRESSVAPSLRRALAEHKLPPEILKLLWQSGWHDDNSSHLKSQRIWQQDVYAKVSQPEVLLGKLRRIVERELDNEQSRLQEGYLFHRRLNYGSWQRWNSIGDRATLWAKLEFKDGGYFVFSAGDSESKQYWNAPIDLDGDGIGDMPSPIQVRIFDPDDNDLNDDGIDDIANATLFDPDEGTRLSLRRVASRWYVGLDAFNIL